MRTTFILATFVAIVLAIFAAIDLHAQTRGPAPSIGGHIAVIDVGYVFKNHGGFNQGKNRWKQDMEAADANLKKEQGRITAMAERLKNFKPGTPDFKKIEEDITQLQASLQVHASLQKKEFLERESKLYYTVYQEVSDAVKYYADRNSINLVLQFSIDPADPSNPRSVMNTINNMVVYQRGVDITPIILDELNRNNPPVGGASPARNPVKTGVTR